MQLFYSPDITPLQPSYTLSQEESKHMIKVLRKKEGDHIHITDGKGQLYQVKITIADAKRCTVEILHCEKKPQKKYRLHMVVAPTKMNDRFEWFLEKATEIGVSEITPLICDRSERKILKMERMQKVVQTAMKQSLQTYLPQLNLPISFKEFMALPHKEYLFIAHCDEHERYALKNRLVVNSDSTILIGPEGDFSPNEIEKAMEKGFLPVTLGENRLRTETAAIVACTTVAMANIHIQ